MGFRRPTHANNNLIAIIPTDNENDSLINDTASKNLPKSVTSKHMHNSDGANSTDILNNEGK